MLRLERLEISGFKSFPEKTQVEFPDGVTAVVGPNGCGKSNVVDAVQWALGEQSPRALRGARMEDVIFAGTSERGPGGMAEVTLHLVARNGTDVLGEGRDRVSMTRRLFRSGESEYLIDGRKARLQDIRAILEQIRAGARTYAVIDQARVAAFVVNKPRERRVFIEEAAGISGYKQRRRLSEMKLEAAEANLLRVEDIVRELERQRRSLQRQASMARRARRLDEEYGALRAMWYARRHRALSARLGSLTELLGVARREAAHLEAERERVEQVLAAARQAVERGQQERDRLIEAIHAGELDVGRLERERDAAGERARALREEAARRAGERRRLEEDREARRDALAALETDLERLEGQAAGLDERLVQARRDADRARETHAEARERAAAIERALYERLHARSGIQSQLSAVLEAVERDAARARELAETRAELEAALGRAREEIARTAKALEAARATVAALETERDAARAREREASAAVDAARAAERALVAELGERAGERAALESLEVRLSGADGARELIERGRRAGLAVERVLAEAIEADPEVERAAETLLADRLAAVIVPDVDQVRAGARLERSGRAALLPVDGTAAARRPREAVPERLARDPRVRGGVFDGIRTRDGIDRSLLDRFVDALLVTDLDAALELHREFPDRDFATIDGHLVRCDGVVVLAPNGGGDGHAEGLLARARRREELGRIVADLERRRRDAHEALRAAESTLAGAAGERAAVEERLSEARRAAATAEVEVGQARREAERLAADLRVLDERLAAASSGDRDRRAEAARLEAALAEAEQLLAGDRRRLDEAREVVHREEERVRERLSALARLEAERTALDERLTALRRELDRARREIAALETRGAEGEQARGAALEQAARLDRVAQDAGRALDELRRRLDALREERERAEGALSGRVETLHDLERRAAQVVEELEGARARRERYGLEAERAEADLAHVVESCLEELGREPAELSVEAPEGADPDLVADDARLAEHLGELRRKRARLGPVNLLAEGEFEELNRRWEETTRQRDDLRQSIDELRASIRRMNKESRERFLDAFHSIRRHFREQFAILFRGGTADLRLDDENDPLEAGIEIVCQPPGKKLQSVTLLSGGEKALAATAVLFAIFRYHPPPFCLLDEVDAPLDDTNIGRFAEALRTFADRTQFIVITHNKRTMELADLLYGVTMPEPGVSRLVSMNLD